MQLRFLTPRSHPTNDRQTIPPLIRLRIVNLKNWLRPHPIFWCSTNPPTQGKLHSPTNPADTASGRASCRNFNSPSSRHLANQVRSASIFLLAQLFLLPATLSNVASLSWKALSMTLFRQKRSQLSRRLPDVRTAGGELPIGFGIIRIGNDSGFGTHAFDAHSSWPRGRGRVCSQSVRAEVAGSTPAFSHHAASSPQRCTSR